MTDDTPQIVRGATVLQAGDRVIFCTSRQFSQSQVKAITDRLAALFPDNDWTVVSGVDSALVVRS